MIKFIKKRYFILILLLFLLMSIPLINADLPFLNSDSSFYVILAHSISSGEGYKDIYYPGNPSNVEFPFFYPLLLAIFLKIYPENYVVFLKFLSILFGIASLVVVQIFFSNKVKTQTIKTGPFTSEHVPLIALFISVNLWFLSFSTSILPEIPYLFFSFTSLILLNKYEQSSKNSGKYFLFTALSLTVTFFTRSIGLALIMAAIIYFIIIKRKKRKGFYIGGICIFLSLPWLMRTILISSATISKNYVGQFMHGHNESSIKILKAIVWNLTHYWQLISTLLLPGFFLSKLSEEMSYFPFLCGLINKKIKYFSFSPLPWLSAFLAFTLFAIVVAGFIYHFKKRKLSEIYILCYLSIVFIFPSRFFQESGNRFITPILPFILFYFFTGLFLLVNLFKSSGEDVKEKQGTKKNKRVAVIKILVCLFVLIANLIPVSRLIKANVKYLINYKFLSLEQRKDYYPSWFMDRFIVAYWIKNNTSPDSIFMHDYPPPFYLVTGRKTVYFTKTPCPEREMKLVEIANTIKQKGVNYIVTLTPHEEKIVRQLNQQIEDMIFFPLVRFESIDEIIKIYKVSKINPQAKTLNQEGIDWYHKRNFNKAREGFKKAIAINAHPLEYFNLGQCYEREGEKDRAIFAYENAAKMQFNYEMVKDKIEIVKQQERIENNPFSYEEYLVLGKLYLKNYKAIDLTIYFFRKALILNPESALVHYNLGRAYIIDEAYDAALSELKISLKLKPELKHKVKHYMQIAGQKKKEKQLSYLGREHLQ